MIGRMKIIKVLNRFAFDSKLGHKILLYSEINQIADAIMNSQWILVEDELPKEEGSCPVWFDEDGERFSRCAYFTGSKFKNNPHDIYDLFPIGWQSLPAPPEDYRK